jgi:hypothetical protein
MPIHHVHVDDCAAAPLGRGNVIGQMGKIRRQNGRKYFYHGVPAYLLAPSVYQRGVGIENDLADSSVRGRSAFIQ